jgi:hypothetical protein
MLEFMQRSTQHIYKRGLLFVDQLAGRQAQYKSIALIKSPLTGFSVKSFTVLGNKVFFSSTSFGSGFHCLCSFSLLIGICDQMTFVESLTIYNGYDGG